MKVQVKNPAGMVNTRIKCHQKPMGTILGNIIHVHTREVHSITYLSTARAPGIVQKHRVQIDHYLCPLHQSTFRSGLGLFVLDARVFVRCAHGV